MGKKGGSGKVRVPKCPVNFCQTPLSDAYRKTCTKCRKDFCCDHQYPIDHECSSSVTPETASSGVVGIVVKSGAGKVVSARGGAIENVESQELAAIPVASVDTVPSVVENDISSPHHDEFMKQRDLAADAVSQGYDTNAFLDKLVTNLVADKGGDKSECIVHGIVGAVVGMGLHRGLSKDSSGLVESMLTLAKDKVSKARPSAFKVIEVLLAEGLAREGLGRAVVPYLLPEAISPLLYGIDGGRSVVESSRTAQLALIRVMLPHDVMFTTSALVDAMHDTSRKSREGAFRLIHDLCSQPRLAHAISMEFTNISEALIECTFDTHPKVSGGAKAALDAIAQTIKNNETQKLRELLVNAIVAGGDAVKGCLQVLMELTFVNAIGAASLALMVPVIVRGLTDRSAEVAMMASMAAHNIIGLTEDPRHLLPFMPKLLPELLKAAEHSNPDVRARASLANDTLKSELGSLDTRASMSGQQVAKPLAQLAEEGAQKFAREVSLSEKHAMMCLDAADSSLAISPEVKEYVSKVSARISIDNPRISQFALGEILADMLSTALIGARRGVQVAEEADAFAHRIASRMPRDVLDSIEDVDEQGNKRDYILNLPGLILAFAGKVLLRATDLVIERGKCYGLVGNNGVGKTTLLTRIAAKDISNFPQKLPCYYVAHEILSERTMPVLEFMSSQVPEGTSDHVIESALRDVGFDDALLNGTVSNLSGGWRMKLAIARSMLWTPELLLLDEPTNHLDVGSVQWLADYVKALRGKVTTILVSHDYEFLRLTLDSVIRVHDKRLHYFPGSFQEFQDQHPDVVDALPSMQKTMDEAADREAIGLGESGTVNRRKKKDLGLGLDADFDRLNFNIVGGSAGTQTFDAKQATLKRIQSESSLHDEPVGSLPIDFPDPGKLDGIRSKSAPVIKLEGVRFTYPGATDPTLQDASIKLAMNSRVALMGKNGAGKTTLLRMLVGETQPDPGHGESWQHVNLRVAYVAQHSMHHLEAALESTPAAYIQNRFALGRDKEMAAKETLKLTEADKLEMQGKNNVCEILGRQNRGKQLFYEVKKYGAPPDKTEWIPLENLLCKGDSVGKLVKNYDEYLKAMQSGMAIRPTTRAEVKSHLESFGIMGDLCDSKIKRFSGGQRSRLVLAAAMWSKPHLLALDEPTNYLDNDTLAALTNALKSFRGAVVMISHNIPFTEQVCSEHMTVSEGKVTCTFSAKKLKATRVAGGSRLNLSSLDIGGEDDQA